VTGIVVVSGKNVAALYPVSAIFLDVMTFLKSFVMFDVYAVKNVIIVIVVAAAAAAAVNVVGVGDIFAAA